MVLATAATLACIAPTNALVHDSVDVDSVRARRGKSGQLCTDSCDHAGNGICEDGGDGAVPSAPSNRACAYGTDCRDCGARGSLVPALLLVY